MSRASIHSPIFQFLVGTSPESMPVSKAPLVPISCMEPARTEFFSFLTQCLDSSLAFSASWYRYLPPPRMAMVFSFLSPATAPMPQRPMTLPISLVRQAILTRFSPAGPMDRERRFWPSARLASSHSWVS